MTPYSPHDLLPVRNPRDENPSKEYFYENVVRHLIPDVLRIMSNGIPLDMDKVKELDKIVTKVIENNKYEIHKIPFIKEFLRLEHDSLLTKKATEVEGKFKSIEDFIKPFDISKIEHRTCVVNNYLRLKGHTNYMSNSFTIKDLKLLNQIIMSSFIEDILNKTISPEDPLIKQGMIELAKIKADAFNALKSTCIDRYKDKLEATLEFNIGSHLQKNKLFKFLGLETENLTKGGAMQINRDELIRLQIETNLRLEDTEDSDAPEVIHDRMLRDMIEIFLAESNASIIRNNFVKNFYEYSIDGVLYSNLNLFGAKTFRLTSNSPNMLNMPSNRNIFTKPFKECLIAPKGYIIYTVDFQALEDRVIANLSKDVNKCNIFNENIDGHCLNAFGYFHDEVVAELPIQEGEEVNDYLRRFFQEVENGNKVLKAIRTKSKSVTFGLNYGAYPPKVASQLKVTLEVAEEIFNNYHNNLYPNITQFREQYVLPTANRKGKIHLGLGCYLYTKNASKEIRTIFNACSQFWSILTLLTINKMHHIIDANNLQEDIKVISTIYDSIYFIVKEDVNLIKWLNDTIIPIMLTDFIENQIVHNEASAEIGTNWYNLKSLENNASTKDIQLILDKLKEKV